MESQSNDYHLDQQIGYLLRLVSQRHSAIFLRAQVHNLTPTQFSALVRVHEVGVCSQNKLGRLTAMDGATIKGVVDRLCKKGLLKQQDDPNDKRRRLISLTEASNGIMSDLFKAGAQISRETTEGLTAKELSTLLKLLNKMI